MEGIVTSTSLEWTIVSSRPTSSTLTSLPSSPPASPRCFVTTCTSGQLRGCAEVTTYSASGAAPAATKRDAGRATGNGSAAGVDSSAPMLEHARQLTQAEELRNVTYEVGDDRLFAILRGHRRVTVCSSTHPRGSSQHAGVEVNPTSLAPGSP